MLKRELVKQFMPSRLTNLMRRQPIAQQNQYIWEGVYSRFQDVPITGAGHASQAYIDATLAHTREIRDRFQSGAGSKPLAIPAEFTLFPMLAAISGFPGQRLAILDVGGGLGISYIYLRASAPSLDRVQYSVVEVEEISQAGNELFAGDQQITFLPDLPGEAGIGQFDLIQFCSSLQYIEDYRAVLIRACSYRPRFLYLLKIPVGDFPTFATAQYNLPGSVVPVWFINHQELVALCAEQGYSLVYQATHDREYDTTNFAPAYRLSLYSHLLFARN